MTLPHKRCPQCSTHFLRRKGEHPYKYARRKFCSRRCSGLQIAATHPRPRVPPKISDEEMRKHITEQLDNATIAAIHKVSMRTVQRTRERIGKPAHPTPRRYTRQELARARLLADEGLPITWVAEDIERGAVELRKKLRRGHAPGWLEVWPKIRRNPTLLALHREFAPQS